MRAITATVFLSLTPFAFGQATLDESARATEDGRPAPAIERVEPNLDAWWQDAVFYEVFVRSFADSSEGPLAGDGVGDLRGLIERLDYLNDGDPATDTDLGVTALWLMPIFQSPSYHGYDTLDYRAIDDEYGTNDDFRDLIAACEERGIRVVLDLVINHCSSDHPWFVEAADPGSDKRDWFVWHDEHPGWKGPWGQPVWHPSPAGDESVYYGLFWHGMPDLNYHNEEATRAAFDIARFWLEDMGAHGFRLDAIRHLIEDGRVQENTPETHAWLRRFQSFVRSVDPEAVTVGEVWSDSDAVSRYVGDQMDLAFEFELSYKLVDSIREQRSAPFVGAMTRVQSLYPRGMYATFLRNHDQPRILHELQGDRDAARLAATIQMCLPGVPFIYYGEEIGMLADKPDPELRTPMQWSGAPNAGFSDASAWKEPKPDYREVNVEKQSEDPASLLNRYRTLVRARLGNEALRTGELVFVESSHLGVLAFLRTNSEGTFLCLFNLTDKPIADYTLDLGDRADMNASGDLLGADVIKDASSPIERLAPRQGAVIRLWRW